MNKFSNSWIIAAQTWKDNGGDLGLEKSSDLPDNPSIENMRKVIVKAYKDSL